MTDTSANDQNNDLTVRLTQLEADLQKQRDLTQTWMGKATDYEKKIGNKNIDAILEAARERDILAAQVVGNDPKKLEEELAKRERAIRDEFGIQLTKKDETLSQVSSRLKELQIVDKVVSKAADKLYPKALDDFKNLIRNICDIDEQENILIKDIHGKTRYSPKNPSVLMSVDELITELAETKDHWFANKIPSGGKTGGERSATGGKVTFAEISKMQPDEQRRVLSGLSEAEREAIAYEAIGKNKV